MSAYDIKRGGLHFSAAIPENKADPLCEARESEMRVLRAHSRALLQLLHNPLVAVALGSHAVRDLIDEELSRS